jgi:hypothetical protein
MKVPKNTGKRRGTMRTTLTHAHVSSTEKKARGLLLVNLKFSWAVGLVGQSKVKSRHFQQEKKA